LLDPLYSGFNERGLHDSSADAIYWQYSNEGYKGTGIETINLSSMLLDAEIKGMLPVDTNDAFVSLYHQLREALENDERCQAFVTKWNVMKEELQTVRSVLPRTKSSPGIFLRLCILFL
jgi:hypothetical protein